MYEAGTSFAPGSRREYRNPNFALAGVSLEQVAGVEHYRYAREHLYQPLGMQQSDSYRHDDIRMPLAGRVVSRETLAWMTWSSRSVTRTMAPTTTCGSTSSGS